jgi:hypothetical protein
VVYSKSWLDEHRIVHLGIVTSGIDVHFVAQSRKGTRKLTNVDIHAAAIARAGLCQRRRVI